MKQKSTPEQVQQMIHLYNVEKIGTVEIGNRLGFSCTTVGTRLKENGIVLTPTSYKLEDSYFSCINTQEKAYFLGLLYADGNLHRTRYIIAITLSEKDGYILDELKRELKTKKPLAKQKGKLIAGTEYSGKPAVKLEVSSQQIHSDLIKLGCVPAKSLILKFPTEEQVPKNQMRHFLRGYFDGDGCIYNSQNRIMINVVGSEDFCNGFAKFLSQELDISVKVKDEKRGYSFYFSIMKIKEVVKFCDYMYNDSTIKMQRKYQKYIDYLKTENWKNNGKANRVLRR